MAARVLSTRELNRALLARQLLLDRGAMPIPKALERVGGLQTQYAPAGYIGLRTRLDGFARDDLTQALEWRTVVQAWMMRSTIHMASKRDFWLFSAAVREQRRRQWSRAFRGAATAKDVAVAARKVERLLAVAPAARRDRRGGRDRQPHVVRRQALARPGPGPTVGHVGATPRRSVRPGDRLAGRSAVDR